MRNPLNKPYRVTSPFGQRMLGGKPDTHYGIDLVPLDGKHPTDIFSTTDGTVVDLRSTVPDSHTGLYVSSMITGNYVNIRTRTQDGCTVIYRHLRASSVCVALGQAVNTGDKLGVMGATGQSTGVHLHYEIRDAKGAALNPALYLDNDKTLGIPESPIKVGDKVKVINAVTYTGGTFRTYFPEYDVIQINGDRAVIGIGNTITAPIHINNIKKA